MTYSPAHIDRMREALRGELQLELQQQRGLSRRAFASHAVDDRQARLEIELLVERRLVTHIANSTPVDVLEQHVQAKWDGYHVGDRGAPVGEPGRGATSTSTFPSDCGHKQSAPTTEEVAAAEHGTGLCARACAACAQSLLWRVDHWELLR